MRGGRRRIALAAAAWLAAALPCWSCAPEIALDADLQYAGGRATHQTDPGGIALVEGDVGVPYDVLGDIEVVARQQGGFGVLPRREDVQRALREQAGRLGADAVVLVAFGVEGMSFWSYHELRAHGRAIRYR